MENKKILVVVPVINLWDRYTQKCLASLKSLHDWHVVLIDNGSTDFTKDIPAKGAMLECLNGLPERLTVIHNATNKGCAGGWNQGLDFAEEHGFTHILIINNDVLLAPVTIDRLAERIDRGDRVLVSAVDISGEVTVAEELFNEASPVNNKEESEAPHPNFSCFMIRGDFVKQIGFFDEGFYPAYFEDNDIHYRIKKIAGDDQAIATTRAVFYHFGSRTQNEAQNTPMVPGNVFEQNRQYYKNKWGGEPNHETFEKPFNDENNEMTYAERK